MGSTPARFGLWRGVLLVFALLAMIGGQAGLSAALAAVADAPPVRRALVIGMSGYDDPAMRVPDDRTKADAEGVAETLRAVEGYVAPTMMPSDADTITFMKVFTEFARTVDAGDQVLLFYSGHGAEFRGDAYLLLREAHADLARDGEDAVTKAALDRSAIKVRDLVEQLQQSGAANIILVLNACRNATDAPLGQKLGAGDAEALGFDLPPPGRIAGLRARDRTGVGTLFATSGNTFAEVCLGDCKTDKSPYTVFGRRFIETLGKPNLRVSDLYFEVGEAVLDDVSSHFPGREQRVDWHDQTSFALRGRIFLGPVEAGQDEAVDEAKAELPEALPDASGGAKPGASVWHDSDPDAVACAELAAPPFWNPMFKGWSANKPPEEAQAILAVSTCEKAADGQPGSVELGFLLGVAHLAAGHYDIALKQFQAGADLKYGSSEAMLGTMYMYGTGVAKNEKDGRHYLELAAAQNDTLGLIGLGNFHYDTKNEDDPVQSENYFKRAAQNGDANVQYYVGKLLETGPINIFNVSFGINQDYDEAARLYRRAAKQGLPEAEYDLARMYVDGRGLIKSDGEALRHFRRAAELGHGEAAFELGRRYGDGKGVAKSNEESLRYYRLAADHGGGMFQFRLGAMYAEGRGVMQSDEEAVHYLQLAADGGDALGQAALGVMFEAGRGVAKSAADAVRLYSLAADQGLVQAQVRLATLYEQGIGVEQSWEVAERYYRIAADKDIAYAQLKLLALFSAGHSMAMTREDAQHYSRALSNRFGYGGFGDIYLNDRDAESGAADAASYFRLSVTLADAFSQYVLASLYSAGRGVDENFPEMVRLLDLAGNQGDALALYELGDRYLNGEGVPADIVAAEKYLVRAADLGDPLAQLEIGKVYHSDSGAGQRDAAAARYLRMAANQGNLEAQNILAAMYAQGDGVPKSDSEAALYYRLAADQGDKGAQKELGDIYAEGRGLPQNGEEAIRYYDLSSDYYNDSLTKIGDIYASGSIVEKDDAKAFVYYKRAVEQGDNYAVVKLGDFYAAGRGVAQNYVEAARLFHTVADSDYPQADVSSKLGDLYAAGLGVVQSDAEAAKYYQIAADDTLGIDAEDYNYKVGMLYLAGKGVPQSDADAAAYFERGANMYSDDAAYEFGLMLEQGRGVAKDVKAAKGWFAMAASGGQQDAKAAFDRLNGSSQ